MAFNTHSLDLEASSSQYATIADASQSGLDLGAGAFTIECFFKRESINAFMGLVSKIKSSDLSGYRLNIQNGNTVNFACSNSTNADTATSIATFTSTTDWYHVVGLRNGTNLKIYVDLVEVASGTDNQRDVSDGNTNPFNLGTYRSDSPQLYFDGLIDEVRVWNVARTVQQLTDNQQVDVSGQTGLVSYWKLNNHYNDFQGGNHLTPSGSPVFSATVPFATYEGTGGMILAAEI